MINGTALRDMILEAAAEIESKKELINALNVFPVPDGDTGTNMSLTLNNAAAELSRVQAPSLRRVCEITSDALLRGARGNSGVITSLLFKGMAKVLKNESSVDGAAFADALAEGSATAYKAVMKPAEGTILTVSRVSAESAVKFARKNRSAEAVLRHAIESAEKALENTVEQNPVLKKAGVVDAGGYGYVVILKAMLVSLTGEPGLYNKDAAPAMPAMTVETADFSSFDTEEITFTYCTEFMVKRGDRRRSPSKLRAFLDSIGDCVVVVDDENVIKVHVHTDAPDRALGEGLKYGALISVKVENMREQHVKKMQSELENKLGERTVAAPDNRYGFVSVAAGEGVCSIFRDLGVDNVVEGGQTMNPSTEDILRAVDATPAQTVFVLPNNKNIIMAAQQAVPLSDKEVIVIESRTIPQGVSAMISFDPEAAAEDNKAAMVEAMKAVASGQITFAARDSDFDGKKIREGDYMCLCEGKLTHNSRRFEDVAKKLAKTMCSRQSGFITIFSGEGSDTSTDKTVEEAFKAAAPNAEINIVPGGQPVYSYIVSVE
ncbi:MAG: DAK2 domain-containing protein [Clostridia bacterium]|nr:DAK2 domain-containing protein [Clostridia bacterium]